MREACSCGAYIQTISHRRVLEWRQSHRHTQDTDDDEAQTARVKVGFAAE